MTNGPSLCRFYCDACGMTEMEMKAIPNHPMFDTDKAKALRDCMQCSRGMIGNGNPSKLKDTRNCKLQVEIVFCREFWRFLCFVLETLPLVKRSALSTTAEGSRVCQPGSPGPVQGRGLRGRGVAQNKRGAWCFDSPKMVALVG